VAAKSRAAGYAPDTACNHRAAAYHRVIEGENEGVITTSVATFDPGFACKRQIDIESSSRTMNLARGGSTQRQRWRSPYDIYRYYVYHQEVVIEKLIP
jgi:hypothetical protein